MPVFEPAADGKEIKKRLEGGALLVACLCSLRCPKCERWWPDFAAESEARPQACFVWVDVDDYPDFTSEFPDLSKFPLLLVQNGERVCFLDSIPPLRAALIRGIEAAPPEKSIDDPHLFEFLSS